MLEIVTLCSITRNNNEQSACHLCSMAGMVPMSELRTRSFCCKKNKNFLDSLLDTFRFISDQPPILLRQQDDIWIPTLRDQS